MHRLSQRSVQHGHRQSRCTSTVKGIQKSEQQHIDLIPDWGIEDDAHAGPWHRQVSLLGYERIEAFKRLGADVENGSFGENIIVEGYDLKALPIGTRFVVGDAVLELTQVGKQCHCIMPREGVFCKVIKGGRVCAGDTFDIIGEVPAASSYDPYDIHASRPKTSSAVA